MAEIVQNEQGCHENLLHPLKLLCRMNPLDKNKQQISGKISRSPPAKESSKADFSARVARPMIL
jgi:hypothetical protein